MHKQTNDWLVLNFAANANSIVAPINPGSIPTVLNLTSSSLTHRTSIGGGISPVNFSAQSQVSKPHALQYVAFSTFIVAIYV